MMQRARCRLWCSGLIGLTAAPSTLAGQRVTLEQVLSAPFASELVIAPTGATLAWVENSKGVRNIWIADGPEYRARPLTAYDSDDGRYLWSLEFTPDGASIVYVRGGVRIGAAGDPPNPTHDPRGPKEEIWIASTSGGDPVRLVDGVAPLVSPAGTTLVYVNGGRIWAMPLLGGPGGVRGGEAQQSIHTRGAVAAMRWSPRGDRLAFVSRRGSYSFIGVYDVAARSVKYLDPSVDNDQEPVWSPDGTRIAYVRVPSDPSEIRYSSVSKRVASPPWSIRVTDLDAGTSREVWRASRGVGSAYWPFQTGSRQQLFWAAGDRLVFPWERTGWLHVYSIPLAGGSPVDLSPGDLEVEHVTLSRTGDELFFSSNQDDIDRRHLWRVSVAGGRPRAVTGGTGIEWWPTPTSDGALAFLASSGTLPPHAELMTTVEGTGSGQRRILSPALPPEFPRADLVEPEQVVFSATDGMRIHGQLFRPANYEARVRYPAIVYLHGGPRAQMVLGYHYLYTDYYQKMYGLNQFLANQGYLVLSVNYRSGLGYGMRFREALNYGSRGATELRDVIGAGLYLRKRADVDPRRIGLWGGSYGGGLTASGLARASDLFAAGVDVHGIQDWNAYMKERDPGYQPSDHPEMSRIAREASPVGHLATWRSPVLIIHGDDDRNVRFAEAVSLIAELRRRGVEVEYLVLPDEIHGFLLHASWLGAFRAAADFFDRKLKATRFASRRVVPLTQPSQ